MKRNRTAPLRRSIDRVDVNQVVVGGGEMGKLIRATDWSKTPLGPVETWPQSLLTAISMMLESRFAMVVAWGPEFRFFYNDRYRPVLGATKHPGALGAPAQQTFPEAWPFIGPLFHQTRDGESVALDDKLIPLDRNGYLENCYFTLSYSPIRDESGGVGGMLAVVAETTERVQAERRLAALRDLLRAVAEAKTAEMVCESATRIFDKNLVDVPFALLYLVGEDGRSARLVSTSGLSPQMRACPDQIDLASDEPQGWPVARAVRSRKLEVVTDLPSRFGALPGGPYPEPTHTAIIASLAKPGQQHPYGILIAGVSPRRAFDDAYHGLFDLAADHILSAIANAHAFQDERERAEALAEIDRAKTAFFSNVSHEFRTPLTLMLGPAEDLLAGAHGELAAPQREQVELFQRNALRLQKLVNALLDFSRIEAGRVQASYQPVDLAELTRDLASAFRSAVEKAGLTLTVTCPPLDERIHVDRDMWEKIVLNLITNAFKFTFEGGIEVSLRAEDKRVVLQVKDTGVGIAPEDMPRLFERFHRVEGTRARTHEGSGIGLALVQELAKLHGGSIEAESTLGAGTTFTVIIPKGSSHLPKERIGAPRTMASTAVGVAPFVEEALHWLPDHADRVGLLSSPIGSPPEARILVADDNADMRNYVRGLLEPQWAVEAVEDGTKALAAALARPPDLVLTDVMMPGLDGFELIRSLRQDDRTKTIPILMLSARAGEEAKVEGLAAGADDYLIKPFSARELVARVRSRLEVSRIQREAAEASALLAEIVRSSDDAILTKTLNGTITSCNQGAERIFAYSANELVGKPITVLIPEERHAEEAQILATLTRGERIEHYETVRRRKDGALIDVSVTVSPVRDKAGRIVGASKVARDITERKRTEQALRESEELYRFIFEAADVSIWDEDFSAVKAFVEELRAEHGEGLRAFLEANPPVVEKAIHLVRIRDVNPATLRMFGASSKEQILGSLEAIFTPETRSVFIQELMAIADGESQMASEAPLRTLDGERREVLASIRFPSPPESFERVLVTLTDITARKEAEERIRRSERQLYELFMQSPAPICVFRGPELTYEMANDLYFRVAGRSDAILGKPLLEAIPEMRGQGFDDLLRGVMRSGEPFTGNEIPLRIDRHGDGMLEDTWWTFVYAPLRNPQGVVDRVMALVHDVTDQVLASKERQGYIEELQRTVHFSETFIGILGHDLRNPLSAIATAASLLSRRAQTDAIATPANRILASSSRMARMIDQLLDFTRIRLGRGLPIERQEVDLSEICRIVIDELEPAKSCTIQFEQVGDLVGHWDRDRLFQLLSNVGGNACQHRRSATTVLLRVDGTQPSSVVLEVWNEGVIPGHLLPVIFEPLQVGTGKKREGSSGLGLGLYISREIVVAHGGTIRVESSEGNGTRFVVWLPRCSTERADHPFSTARSR